MDNKIQLFMTNRLVAISKKRPFIKGPATELLVERQFNDTLLPDAGVPLREGDLYYGLHIFWRNPGTNFVGAIATDLMVMAELINSAKDNWRYEKVGPPPEYMVGVTYGSLAKMAHRLLDFTIAPLEESAFTTPANSAVGWNKYKARLEDIYYDTDAGLRNKPLDYGAVFTRVDAFIDMWRPGSTQYNKVKKLLPERLQVRIREAE